MTARVLPFPGGVDLHYVERTEVGDRLDIVLYTDGCGGLVVYEEAPSPGAPLGVVAAVPLEADEMEAAGRALLACAAKLRGAG